MEPEHFFCGFSSPTASHLFSTAWQVGLLSDGLYGSSVQFTQLESFLLCARYCTSALQALSHFMVTSLLPGAVGSNPWLDSNKDVVRTGVQMQVSRMQASNHSMPLLCDGVLVPAETLVLAAELCEG